VHVLINGESQTVHEGLSLAGLIDRLGLNQRRIAIEVNREIIARDHYVTHILEEGDAVEIVHFVGGG
jgi:thiamine biosynthesis protein ThiS